MTLSSEDQKLAQLIQKIAPQDKLLRMWPLTGGISAEMTAFELADPDGQRKRLILRRPGEAALKQNPHAAADEFKLLQTTHSLGLATPRPYYFDPSGRIFPTPYLVVEYIEGEPEFVPADLADFTLQLAAHLAQIHRVDGSTPDLSFLPRRVPGFAEQFGPHSPIVDPGLDEGRIRQTLAAVWPLTQRNTPVLLHGDFWPGNILWRNGRLAAVIDWEDASLGDPLADLAISRLDLLWIFGREAMDSFTHHYQALIDIDYTNLPYWDLAAALRLVRLAGADLAGWAAFFPPFGRPDITAQTIRDHYRFFISQAFEKVSCF
ncbi:MAG: phosphotransferase [Chloroflexota bacterium]|nr:MAG: phosphotransferase [Chloroflexota bacterium]